MSTDLQGQESEPYKIPGGVMLSDEGPPLQVEPISAGEGEFGFKVITEPGADVRIESQLDALRMRFTAEEETTEFRIKVPEGEHIIKVFASSGSGPEAFDILSSAEKPSSGSGKLFLLLILFLLALFGGVAFVKRQDIIDEYHNRKYR